MGIGGATLAGAAMRAGLIDEYALATHPVLVGGGTPFFTALDSWVNLVETRTFPRRRRADQVRDEALSGRYARDILTNRRGGRGNDGINAGR